jgi:hypothetical protein
MKWAGHVAFMGEMRNAYDIFIRKPEGKRPCRRPRCRWEVNIVMVARLIGWEGVFWMHVAEGMDQWWAPVKVVMNLQVP